MQNGFENILSCGIAIVCVLEETKVENQQIEVNLPGHYSCILPMTILSLRSDTSIPYLLLRRKFTKYTAHPDDHFDSLLDVPMSIWKM